MWSPNAITCLLGWGRKIVIDTLKYGTKLEHAPGKRTGFVEVDAVTFVENASRMLA